MPYFDHNATTPLSPRARAAWLRAQDEAWQNPSSPHRAGARVRVRLEAARQRLADLLEGTPERLVFTSGATEAADAIATHLACRLAAEARVWVNPTEHPSVLEALSCRLGSGRLVPLPLTPDGVVTPEALARQQSVSGSSRPGAVVVMAANNETGVLQPWSDLANLCREWQVPYVCDASQWLGKLPAAGLGQVDWLFATGHKFGAPKGVGFLQRPADENGFVIRRGGGQQAGQRGGTEDYPAVAALVAALVEAEETQVLHETERLRWREQFEAELTAALPGARVIGAAAERLWNTVSLLLPEGENTRWVARLDHRGFAVSTGSACATGQAGPSHVLAALGLRPEEVRRVVRISAGWEHVPADWQGLREAMVAVAAEVSAGANVVSG